MSDKVRTDHLSY